MTSISVRHGSVLRMAGGMHPRGGPGVPLGQRPGARAPHVPSEAFLRLTGQPVPPPEPVTGPGHCWVLADSAAGDDVAGELPGVAAEVIGDHVRVVYALGDEDHTVVESWLHVDQVRAHLAAAPTT